MAKYAVDTRPSVIDFECGDEPVRRVLQNCKNLLMCRMGEVPYDRMRGIDPALFDRSMPEVNSQLLPEIDRVLGWEPRANPISAVADMDDNGDTVITVVVDINL